jgi:hypothetical protein
VTQRIGAAALVELGEDRRLFDTLRGQAAVKSVGEPVGGAVEVDHDGRENRAVAHLLGVAFDGFVGCLQARLRAAVDVDRFEEISWVCIKKGRVF